MSFFGDNNKYSAAYNGVSCNRYGLYVKERPNIPTAQKKINEYEILGRDGKLYSDTGFVEDREFPINIGFFGNKDEWVVKYRAIKNWLKTKTNNDVNDPYDDPMSYQYPFNVLQIADNTRFYYKVKKITLDTTEREAIDIGHATVTFTIDGYDYDVEGFKKIQMERGVIYNPKKEFWTPLFEIWRGLDSISEDAKLRLIFWRKDPFVSYERVGHWEVTLPPGGAKRILIDTSNFTVVSGVGPYEAAYNKIQGAASLFKNTYAISWDVTSEYLSADFSVTMRPLYKEI